MFDTSYIEKHLNAYKFYSLGADTDLYGIQFFNGGTVHKVTYYQLRTVSAKAEDVLFTHGLIKYNAEKEYILTLPDFMLDEARKISYRLAFEELVLNHPKSFWDYNQILRVPMGYNITYKT